MMELGNADKISASFCRQTNLKRRIIGGHRYAIVCKIRSEAMITQSVDLDGSIDLAYEEVGCIEANCAR